MQLSLVIPAFNEGKKIRKDVEFTAKFLQSKPYSSEVLIVDDGSSDDTRAVATSTANEWNSDKVQVKVLSYGANRGKGYAVRFGVSAAQGRFIGFMDSGMCVPLTYVDTALDCLEAGAPFAIASRRLPGTKITRPQPWYRKAGSKVFWYLMRGLMGVDVTDTQCGFKFFESSVAKRLFSKVKTDGFMFDVEVLMLAKRLGVKGREFAVEWSNDSDSRYHLIFGTIKNVKEILRIRRSLSQLDEANHA